MEELGEMLNYQPFDELNQQIVYANLEVEFLKMQLNEKFKMKRDLNEQLKNIREQVKNLFNLVTVSYQEKDELQNLINHSFLAIQSELPNTFPGVQPEALAVIHPTKANSSITESNSFSRGSSPVDSIFEHVSSSEFNAVDSKNMGYVNQPLIGDYNCSAPPAFASTVKPSIDPWDNVIDSVARGKGLPQQGKLLQAVMDAGPLLQTVIVSGPLPRWRNPPPPQPIKVPPFVIKEFETQSELKTVPDTPFLKPFVSSSRTVLQPCSAATPSATWNNAANAIVNNHNQVVPSYKRQRR
ncbi:hypothetical protein L6164_019173 [Bauhinia variegata]|uniref:Uncharacterized protein n=1 Tax=Bauhinia variegata TaxID=167791 RepID=A0ACB9NEN0_BAUVA|nr:hypothetical protein L6164_019173 [Bauhinia variegata]